MVSEVVIGGHWGPSQTAIVELFANIDNGLKRLTVFRKKLQHRCLNRASAERFLGVLQSHCFLNSSM